MMSKKAWKSLRNNANGFLENFKAGIFKELVRERID